MLPCGQIPALGICRPFPVPNPGFQHLFPLIQGSDPLFTCKATDVRTHRPARTDSRCCNFAVLLIFILCSPGLSKTFIISHASTNTLQKLTASFAGKAMAPPSRLAQIPACLASRSRETLLEPSFKHISIIIKPPPRQPECSRLLGQGDGCLALKTFRKHCASGFTLQQLNRIDLYFKQICNARMLFV